MKAGAHPPQPAPGADSWSEFLALSGLQVPPPHSKDENSPRDVPENHMGSSFKFLVLTRYQVLDLQLGCMKKKREIPGTVNE